MIDFKNRGDAVDIYVYGEITSSAWDDSDVTTDTFREKLDDAGGKPVNVYVNSGGGSVFVGQAIASLLERYEGSKTCYIDGLCASIATKIPFACDKTYFAEGAYFMIHRASAVAWGNYDDLLKMADTLEQIDNGLAKTYVKNSTMTKEEALSKMKAETWYTSDNINEDFNFEIVEGKEVAAYVSEETLKNYINKPDGMTTAVPDKPANTIGLEIAIL